MDEWKQGLIVYIGFFVIHLLIIAGLYVLKKYTPVEYSPVFELLIHFGWLSVVAGVIVTSFALYSVFKGDETVR